VTRDGLKIWMTTLVDHAEVGVHIDALGGLNANEECALSFLESTGAPFFER